MKCNPLGDSGIEASAVGFGAWAIGGWMWGGVEEAEAVRAIRAAIDAGITLVDTAPVYGFGTSEEIVGKAIRDCRNDVVLATKCGLVWHTDRGDHFFDSTDEWVTSKGAGEATRTVHRYLAPESIRYEVEQSLQRLGVDHIDLLQTHWQESSTPIADTMGELLKLKEEGKIRAIGVSNATPAQMDEYRQAGQLDADQEKYSMLDRKHERENLPYCAENNLAFLAYSPIAQGLLTGKMGPERSFGEGDQRRRNERFSVPNRVKVNAMLGEFKSIAAAHGISLAQLAIAWTLHQEGCTHALVGARTPKQAEENAAAGDVTLSPVEVANMRLIIETEGAEIV